MAQPHRGKGVQPTLMDHVGLEVWEFGEWRVAILMATAPPSPNFLTQGGPHRPDAKAGRAPLK